MCTPYTIQHYVTKFERYTLFLQLMKRMKILFTIKRQTPLSTTVITSYMDLKLLSWFVKPVPSTACKTSPLYLHDLITIKQSKYSFRYQNTASIPSTRTTRYGIKTFKYFAAKTWNELPNHFRLENSFEQFKNLINSWNGSSCHCNASR